MPNAACTDEEFIEMFRSLGPVETGRKLNVAASNVFARRRRLERMLGIVIEAPNAPPRAAGVAYPKRVPFGVENGVVLVGSDAHYWPGEAPPAHRALVKLAREMSPKLLVLNGDVLDGASISRYPRPGWDRPPTLKEELRAVEERLSELEAAARRARRIWTLGNHDARFEARLANSAPQYQGVSGFSLRDRFPRWEMALSLWINGNVVVKHRFKGGIHATHNNTLWAGKTVVTGHLHSLKVTPFDDYNGTRFGVDTGTLSDPHGAHADYAEDNPLNHRSGFMVLTFHKGKLLWPEPVAVIDSERVQFRGQIIKV